MTPFGLLGGTFDPIHSGHLDLARAARRALGLERVVLMPSHVPPHRDRPYASAAHRFAMVALAIQAEDGLVASDLELESDGPSYTSRTLDRLETEGTDTRSVYFVTGADAFRDIPSWMDFPAILDRCQFVVISRPGVPVASLRDSLPSLAPRLRDAPFAPTAGPGIFLVDARTADVSSTEVRRRVAAGESLAGLVPGAVAAHIARHGLYGPPAAPAAGGQGGS